jgi:hypothetical protein
MNIMHDYVVMMITLINHHTLYKQLAMLAIKFVIDRRSHGRHFPCTRGTSLKPVSSTQTQNCRCLQGRLCTLMQTADAGQHM